MYETSVETFCYSYSSIPHCHICQCGETHICLRSGPNLSISCNVSASHCVWQWCNRGQLLSTTVRHGKYLTSEVIMGTSFMQVRICAALCSPITVPHQVWSIAEAAPTIGSGVVLGTLLEQCRNPRLCLIMFEQRTNANNMLSITEVTTLFPSITSITPVIDQPFIPCIKHILIILDIFIWAVHIIMSPI